MGKVGKSRSGKYNDDDDPVNHKMYRGGEHNKRPAV